MATDPDEITILTPEPYPYPAIFTDRTFDAPRAGSFDWINAKRMKRVAVHIDQGTGEFTEIFEDED